MNVATVYIATDGGSFDGFTHLLVNRRLMLGTTRKSVTIDRTCGEVHDARIDYTECPIASRWTVLRALTPR